MDTLDAARLPARSLSRLCRSRSGNWRGRWARRCSKEPRDGSGLPASEKGSPGATPTSCGRGPAVASATKQFKAKRPRARGRLKSEIMHGGPRSVASAPSAWLRPKWHEHRRPAAIGVIGFRTQLFAQEALLELRL